MSEYPCGECGKYTDLVGGICQECNRAMGEEQAINDEIYYSLMAKCLSCYCLNGEDHCSEYPTMPLFFFRRQKNCKNFIPIDYNESRW